MPRLIARDYHALAERQNRQAWAWHEQPPATAIDTRLENSADRAQARYLQARRDRLVSHVNDISACPDLFWRHRYFGYCSGGVVASAEDAVDELRRVLALERRRLKHWSRKPERIVALTEALVFARYFRRFASRVWMREAA